MFHNLPTKFGQFGISSCADFFCPVIYIHAARQCRCHVARSSSGLGRRPLKAEITSSNLVRATTSFLLRLMARSSSGLGRRPLKAEITSSNLVRATTSFLLRLMARSSSGLGRRPLKAEITSSNLVRATTHLIPGLPMEGRVFYFQTTVCNSRLNQSFAFCLWPLRVQYPRYFDC